ncbi:hypothetical protein ACP4OV_025408 [Aristida adscensionis]
MTAEGTARGGAGEAPKAEFAAGEKVAAAPLEEGAPGEREGGDVGGPFVIVNGDSDGMSDRGSDLGKAHGEDSPSEGEDDAPGSNAGPGAAAGGGHGAAGGEAGAPDAADGVPSADGRDRAAAEAEGGADECNGKASADVVAEVVQQETAGGDQDVEDGAAGGELGTPDAAVDVSSEGVTDDSQVEATADVVAEVVQQETADVVSEVAQQETARGDQNVEDALAAGGEVGTSDNVVNISQEGGTDESKGEVSADVVSEEVQLETAAGDQDVEDALVVSGSDHAVTGADSAEHAVDSEINVQERITEENATAGGVELMLQETSSTEQNGTAPADAAESSGLDAATDESIGHVATADSGSAVVESDVSANEIKDEPCAAGAVEPVNQGSDGAGALMVNGHLSADTKADSFEAAVENDSHAEESKQEHSAAEVAELMEQDAACGQYNAVDVQLNGHIHVAKNSESCASAFEPKDSVIENKAQESDQEQGAPVATEDNVLEGQLEADDKNSGAGCTEEPIEVDDVDTNGHSYSEASGDASGEPKLVMEVEDGVTCGILQLEDKMGKGSEDTQPESDPSVESSQEQKFKIEEVAKDDEIAESNLKADNVIAVADRVEISNINSTCDVEESEVKSFSFTEVAHSALQNCKAVVETGEDEQLEASDIGLEPKEEVVMEVVDADPSQASAASGAELEHPSPGVELEHSCPGAELKSCELVRNNESRSREISNIDRVVSGDSLVRGTSASDEAELASETGVKCQEQPAQSCSATGDESVAVDEAGNISKRHASSDIVDNSKSLQDQPDICNASALHDECSSRIGNEGSSAINGVAFPTEEACPSDDACKDICSENGNASINSSEEVETKYLEAPEPSSAELHVGENGSMGDAQVNGEEMRTPEESSELHVDLDNGNVGKPQIFRKKLKQPLHIIKIPKFAGEDLWAKAQEAELRMDQLTRERDAINLRKQKQRAVCEEFREKFDIARKEEEEARAAHGVKKHDLNSVRTVIGKLNQANSIEEIDEMIARKENTMQHHTIPLKEEKLLIKEINELKAQRKQLCANMGSKSEINEAFHQKDQIHERHQSLKKDSDVLFSNLKSLEESTRKIKKSYDDERAILKKLNEEYRAANDVRQKAYRDWVELKAAPRKKNAYFLMYKHDREAANEYLMSGDMYGLKLHCNNQIEKVMEMWNKDEDFRKEYIEVSKFNTIKRLGSHDGRRLGPDEDPPFIPTRRPINPSSGPSKMAYSSPDVTIASSVAMPVEPATVSVTVENDSFPVLPIPQMTKRAKSKASGSSAQNEIIAVAVSEKEDVKQTEKEKARLMEEELELARKAEELARRQAELSEERAAAEKERLRLEQKAKAKEAEERKKRKAEKAQERAEFKARKEAEIKEKKKAKKDKKKGPSDQASGSGDGNNVAAADTEKNTSVNPRDADVPQPTAAPKRLSRPAAVMKQLNRVEPMPLPLRNRGKRKMRQYIMAVVAVLSVLALFMAGNYIPQLKSLHF